MSIAERFRKKIYEELRSYQKMCGTDRLDYTPQKEKIMTSLYEILISKADDFSDVLLNNLVNQSTNILETLYEDIRERDLCSEYIEENLNHSFSIGYNETVEDENWWNNIEEGEGM